MKLTDLPVNMVAEEMSGKPVFQVGDLVQIVPEPYESCAFSWIGAMDRYCDQQGFITSSEWSESCDCFIYHITTDNECYSWDANCFVNPEKKADFEVAGCDFDAILNDTWGN